MNRGFSLLEMLLTLAMSVVLMGLISGAISFYARDMESAEDEFRQSQIATAVLQMIEDDLRMVLVTTPVDTAALGEVLASASSPLQQMGIASTGEEETATEESSTELPPEDLATTDDVAAMDLTMGTGVLQKPGLIGNASQLQIDVSRLPTLESYAFNPTMSGVGSAAELVDRPSDLKTVSYYVVSAGTIGPVDPLDALANLSANPSSAPETTGGSESTGGLVRRAIDRAISSQASATGGLSRLLQTGELIAREIAAIEFEYFDGITWLPQFSSDETGFLPLAIRVTLTMSAPVTTSDQAVEPRLFTHIIALPMSRPEDAQTTTDDMSTDGGTL